MQYRSAKELLRGKQPVRINIYLPRAVLLDLYCQPIVIVIKICIFAG